jgi:antirestriction protein ArdC
MPKSGRSNRTSTPRRSSQDALTHVTAEIAGFLERGVIPWRAPWDSERALAVTPGLPLRSTGQPYRGANIFLLWAAQMSRGYNKRTWLTYRQALQLGGQVRKGEKACPVVYYGQATSNHEGEASDTSGKAEEGRQSYRFLKLFHVFNVEQIEGLPAEFGAEPTIAEPITSPALHDWVLRAGAHVRVGGQVACYSPAIDAILLPHISAFRSEEHWTATLAHESIHWTGAKSRLDRLGDYFTDKKARAREELCAELGAAMIGAMTGIAPFHLEDHASYIASWLKLVRDEPRAFLSAGAKAQAALDFLIEKAGHPLGASDYGGDDEDPSVSISDTGDRRSL